MSTASVVSTTTSDTCHLTPVTSRPFRRTLRALSATILLAACASLPGCTLIENASNVLIVEPHAFARNVDHKRTRRAYRKLAREQLSYCGHVSPDYAYGFEEGFVDYLTYGGNGEQPIVPPREYWRLPNRSPGGYDGVAEWFNGWEDGVASAMSTGLREWGTVPSSLLTGYGEIITEADEQPEELLPPGDPFIEDRSHHAPRDEAPVSRASTRSSVSNHQPTLHRTTTPVRAIQITNPNPDQLSHLPKQFLATIPAPAPAPPSTADPAPSIQQASPTSKLAPIVTPGDLAPRPPAELSLQPAAARVRPITRTDQPDLSTRTEVQTWPSQPKPRERSAAPRPGEGELQPRSPIRQVGGYATNGSFEQSYETITGHADAEPVRPAIFVYSPDDPLKNTPIPPAVLKANAFDAEQPLPLQTRPGIFKQPNQVRPLKPAEKE